MFDEQDRSIVTAAGVGPDQEPSATPSRSSADEDLQRSPDSSRANYVVRHWRGELSLPISYWLNGFAGNIVVVIAAAVLSAFVSDATHATALLLFAVAIWTLIAAVSTWQTTGVIRSARNYMAQGSSRVWGRLAQTLMVLNILLTLQQLTVAGIPQIIELAKMAMGDPEIEQFEIFVSDDGRVLEVRGGVKQGLVDAVKASLDKNPQVDLIDLNSGGGRIAEARRLNKLINDRGLATFTSEICASACTLAFAGGNPRGMAGDAQLGFHEPAFPGIDRRQMQFLLREDKALLRRAGVKATFIEQAFTVDHSDMWYPEPRELLSARFITQEPGPLDLEAEGGVSLDYVKRTLQQQPSLSALAKSQPEKFTAIATRARRELRAGASQEDVVRDAVSAARSLP